MCRGIFVLVDELTGEGWEHLCSGGAKGGSTKKNLDSTVDEEIIEVEIIMVM